MLGWRLSIFFFPMQGDIYWGPNREVLFGFMCNEEEIKELRKKLNKMTVSHIIWMDKDYGLVLLKFRGKIVDIMNEFNKSENLKNNNELKLICVKYIKSIDEVYYKIVTSLTM